MPTALRSLDDKVIGRRGARNEPDTTGEPYPDEPRGHEREVATRRSAPESGTGDGLRELLAIFARVSKAVFFALAAILVLGIVFVLAPTNADNVLVDFVADVSSAVAGPFSDVFTVADDADREIVVNYGFAAAVYAVLGILVGKLAPSTR